MYVCMYVKKNIIKGQQTINSCLTIGSLSNDDGDGNENGKTELGLDWQNNNFACVSCFFVHFLAVATRPCMTWKCLMSRFVQEGNTRQQLSFSFPELWYSPFEFNTKKFEVWGSANSLFKWCFRSRCHGICLSSIIAYECSGCVGGVRQ